LFSGFEFADAQAAGCEWATTVMTRDSSALERFADLVALVSAGQRKLEELQARVAELERQAARRSTTRDGEDARILSAVFAVAGGERYFSAGDLLRHAQSDARLHAALDEADIDSAKALGKCLSRLRRRGAVDGLQIVVVDDKCRGHLLWACRPA
jgi:hypothetical protein